MIDYSSLGESELIELLSTYTTKYTGNLAFHSDSDALRECKKVVDEIVDEFTRRQSQKSCRTSQQNEINK